MCVFCIISSHAARAITGVREIRLRGGRVLLLCCQICVVFTIYDILSVSKIYTHAHAMQDIWTPVDWTRERYFMNLAWQTYTIAHMRYKYLILSESNTTTYVIIIKRRVRTYVIIFCCQNNVLCSPHAVLLNLHKYYWSHKNLFSFLFKTSR